MHSKIHECDTGVELLPREHVAWSLLLTPFAASLLIARRWNGDILAVLCAVAALFLLRAPLIALARQRWVWKEARPEAEQARRWLAWLGPVLILSGGWLASRWGLAVAAGLGGIALLLSVAAVAMTIANRQRTAWFQVVSCAGLTFSAVAAARAATGGFPNWAWILWGLCVIHGAAGILVVHARLDAIVASKRKPAPATPGLRPAWIAIVLAGAASVAIAAYQPWLALAPALAAAAQAAELAWMDVSTPLKTVGLRAMTLSIFHALALVLVLS
ncbi:MAG: YwiC-like family protein [Acidobacteria bacterium]|nr:YwiC-like family protein [Acidobacteriota bacterium]